MGTMQKNNTRRLTESAIMVALAAVLAMVKVWEMPLGGSVTAACMAPIIFIALRYGAKWGLLTGLVFAVIQMIEGFWAPPVRTLLWFFLVVMLDYVLPFGLLGLAPLVVQGIFDIIRTINKEGVTVLLIEQNANMALKVADFAYVLETGTITKSGTGAELLADESIKEAYLGKSKK